MRTWPLTSPQDDKFHEECGVFGVWNVPDAAAASPRSACTRCSIAARKSTGIVTFDGSAFPFPSRPRPGRRQLRRRQS